jgi:hypothetical protein
MTRRLPWSRIFGTRSNFMQAGYSKARLAVRRRRTRTTTVSAVAPKQRWVKAGVIITVLGLTATIAQHWQKFLPTRPTIEVDGLEAAPPLGSAFYIRNESFIFPLRITSLGCRVLNIEPIVKGEVWVGSNFSDYIIWPTRRVPMMCKIKPDGGNTRVDMQVIVRFTWWPFGGGKAAIPVYWVPNRWTVGDIMR